MQVLAFALQQVTVHHSHALTIAGLTFLIFAFVLCGALAIAAKQKHRKEDV
jgi:hypothetical protein